MDASELTGSCCRYGMSRKARWIDNVHQVFVFHSLVVSFVKTRLCHRSDLVDVFRRTLPRKAEAPRSQESVLRRMTPRLLAWWEGEMEQPSMVRVEWSWGIWTGRMRAGVPSWPVRCSACGWDLRVLLLASQRFLGTVNPRTLVIFPEMFLF